MIKHLAHRLLGRVSEVLRHDVKALENGNGHVRPVPGDCETQGGTHLGHTRTALRSAIVQIASRMLHDGAQHHGAHFIAVPLQGKADQHPV
eukprot:7032493-Prymnesium_polylepis.1